MPHRTTYFFPRQFPDRSFDAASSKQLLDREKKVANETASATTAAAGTATTANTFKATAENDRNKSISGTVAKDFSAPAAAKTNNNNNSNNSPLSDLFTDEKIHTKKQQLAAFRDWFIDKKATNDRSRHVKPPSRRLSLSTDHDDDCELLLHREPAPAPPQTPPPPPPPPPETTSVINDRSFDRQVSLPRFSSGSSYAGSLFSGTTLDGNLSSDVKDTWIKESSSTTPVLVTREVEEPEAEESKDNLALKSKESYYLQIMLARRLTSQASLLSEPLLIQEYSGPGPGVADAETVSYRLWVLI